MEHVPKAITTLGILFVTACSDVEEPVTTLPSYADLDTDGNGYLSRQEAEQVPELADIFALADENGDDRLSTAEFSHATLEGTRVSAEAAEGPRFEVVDANGNGSITREEAESVSTLAEHFDAFDADGSGTLNQREYLDGAATGFTPE